MLFHGRLEVSDEQQMALTTRAIAERMSLTWDQELLGLRFSGYGMGTSVAALPFFFLDKFCVATGVLKDAPWNLLPMTNAVLVALLGVLLAGLLEGERRWGAVALLVTASPLLPASLTLTSEPLTAVGMAALAVGLWHDAPGRRGPLVLAFLGTLAAVLARLACVPLLGLIGIWGLCTGATRRSVVAGAVGGAVGLLATMLQNKALRGGFFTTGYGGQEFTTPLTTGLYGLLISPERGLLIFFPAVLAPIFGWEQLRGRMRSLGLLAAALILFSLVFHGLFWTWHGGWTSGPRFLLPALAFAVPPIAELLMRWPELSGRLRWFLRASLGWSLLLALIYSRHSAYAWWNQLWGFHQVENQWLFMPQLSLWTAWFQGIPLPVRQAEMGSMGYLILSLGVGLCLVALCPLVGTWQSCGEIPDAVRLAQWRPSRRLSLGLAGFLLLFAIVPLLKGPRGWKVVESSQPLANPKYLLVEGQGAKLEGWVDYPLNGPLHFAARANATYKVAVDYETVLEERKHLDQHLPRFDVNLPAGMHFLEVEFAPKDDRPLFQLYWTWGGEGRYLEPVGGEYILPRPLEPVERLATAIWRRRFLIVAGILALLLLLGGLRSREIGRRVA